MKSDDVKKGLEQDSQRILARPVKNADAENTREIAQALKAVMAERKISQAQVARWIGYSATTISEFLSGRYKGDYETIANKICSLVNSIHRKQQAFKDKAAFIETGVATAIWELAKRVESFSEDEGKVGLIAGDSGHGKSCCLREYSKANLNTVYVELDNTMTSVGIFGEIAKSMGLDSSGTLPVIAERIIEILRHRHLVIMLDEASALTVKQLNQLRQVINVKGRCPMILAGNQNLLTTTTQTGARRGCESLDQFASRVVGILNLDEMALDSGGDLYTPDDIRKLYEYGGIRLAADGIEALRRICRTPQTGRLRTCNHIVMALHTLSSVQENGYIGCEAILKAIGGLSLAVKERLPLSVLREVHRNQDTLQAAIVR